MRKHSKNQEMPLMKYLVLFNTSKVPNGVWLQSPSQLCFRGTVLGLIDDQFNHFNTIVRGKTDDTSRRTTENDFH